MHRVVLLVLVAARGVVADEEIKEDVAAAYYSPPQSEPSYGYEQPPYQPPSYQPPQYYQPQMMLPPFALPTYDVAYCSVFASFPLVGAKKHHRDHRRRGGPGMRKFERQSCRNTALFSWKSCDTCCKISSRVNEKVPISSITGALFVFDPDMDFNRPSHDFEDGKEKALQCVCCAPKVY
ncbi:hypothetical protein GCK32_009970 [Trichostrongylus colubriformis]|uniref:Uncharacterized protein n=1 Tax=Trichostrongylus colubriformis TaxID=6319 RepID=A0AAN8EMC7_TRICO